MAVRLATDAEITDARLTSRQILAAAADVCTDRQLHTLVLLEQGLSTREIAGRLHVSRSTARSHLDAALGNVRRGLPQ